MLGPPAPPPPAPPAPPAPPGPPSPPSPPAPPPPPGPPAPPAPPVRTGTAGAAGTAVADGNRRRAERHGREVPEVDAEGAAASGTSAAWEAAPAAAAAATATTTGGKRSADAEDTSHGRLAGAAAAAATAVVALDPGAAGEAEPCGGGGSGHVGATGTRRSEVARASSPAYASVWRPRATRIGSESGLSRGAGGAVAGATRASGDEERSAKTAEHQHTPAERGGEPRITIVARRASPSGRAHDARRGVWSRDRHVRERHRGAIDRTQPIHTLPGPARRASGTSVTWSIETPVSPSASTDCMRRRRQSSLCRSASSRLRSRR